MSRTPAETTRPHRTARRGTEPEDAHREFVAPAPANRDEALADREMADAERAVVTGSATEEQATRVRAVGEARTQEDRRRLWMDGA